MAINAASNVVPGIFTSREQAEAAMMDRYGAHNVRG
jgi:hypothetical protein